MSKTKKDKQNQKSRFDYQPSRLFALLFPAIYALALTVFCVVYQIIPGPEFLVLIFLIYAAYNRKTWRFLKDWLPFITVFLSYEAMYSIVGIVAKNNLHGGPLNLELQIFGQIPALYLQNFYRLPILDYLCAFFYSSHFFLPTIFAFILWRESPKNYWKYTIGFAVCVYSALITFLVYPVAPPWYAIPEVTRILTVSVDQTLGLPVYKTIFDFLSPNQFAAFPSLHSALPWLISLFAIKIWKIKALPTLVIPFGVWFSVIYLGEHYIVDIFGGIVYGAFAFIVAEHILPWLSNRYQFLKKHIPKTEIKPIP